MSTPFRVAQLFLGLMSMAPDKSTDFHGNSFLFAICQSGARVSINRRSEARELVRTLDLGGKFYTAGCSAETMAAIRDLNFLVGDPCCACTPERAIKVVHYQTVYNQLREQLPGPLHDFFVAFGLRFTENCRRKMIDLLAKDSQQHLTPGDMASVERWVRRVDLVVGTTDDKKDDYPRLMAWLSDIYIYKQEFDHQRQFLQIEPQSEVKRIDTICRYRLRPIYERLVSPVVWLWRSGFSYYEGQPADPGPAAQDAGELTKWLKVVWLCEILSSVEIVESRAKKIRAHLLSRARARKLLLGAPRDDDKNGRLVYVPQAEPRETIGDLVLDRDDRNLIRSMARFDSWQHRLDTICNALSKYILNTAVGAYLRGPIISSWCTARQRGPLVQIVMSVPDQLEQLMIAYEEEATIATD